jgi:hypothetical protein
MGEKKLPLPYIRKEGKYSVSYGMSVQYVGQEHNQTRKYRVTVPQVWRCLVRPPGT